VWSTAPITSSIVDVRATPRYARTNPFGGEPVSMQQAGDGGLRRSKNGQEQVAALNARVTLIISLRASRMHDLHGGPTQRHLVRRRYAAASEQRHDLSA
jgi:hypothetical protein